MVSLYLIFCFLNFDGSGAECREEVGAAGIVSFDACQEQALRLILGPGIFDDQGMKLMHARCSEE